MINSNLYLWKSYNWSIILLILWSSYQEKQFLLRTQPVLNSPTWKELELTKREDTYLELNKEMLNV